MTLRQERLEKGLCPDCGKAPRGESTKLCDQCRERKAEASRRSRRNRSLQGTG